jgi:hypothetical protein
MFLREEIEFFYSKKLVCPYLFIQIHTNIHGVTIIILSHKVDVQNDLKEIKSYYSIDFTYLFLQIYKKMFRVM